MFDFINHDSYLLKHFLAYCASGLQLLWLTRFLKNNLQNVKINSCFSNLPILAGVSYRSILGPPLFNVFITDVFQFNSASSEI